MNLPCLRNWDVALTNCVVSDEGVTAALVQIDPNKIDSILGAQVELKQAKVTGSPIYYLQVPEDLSPVHTEVFFPFVKPNE